MTRMPQVRPMPRGLTWLIVPDAAGNLVLCLAPGLSCQQRKEALRAYERACSKRGIPARAAAWGTAAIIAFVAITAALLAFSSPPAQRARPAGSVNPAIGRHHARRREDHAPHPRPRPQYVP